jgi:hypothetical protein
VKDVEGNRQRERYRGKNKREERVIEKTKKERERRPKLEV